MTTATDHSAPHESGLNKAVRAVNAALAALSSEPAGPRVEDAIERADHTLEALEPGLSTIVLARLLTSIRDCHREGRHTSAQLRARRVSAARALRLDPHRYPDTARRAS